MDRTGASSSRPFFSSRSPRLPALPVRPKRRRFYLAKALPHPFVSPPSPPAVSPSRGRGGLRNCPAPLPVLSLSLSSFSRLGAFPKGPASPEPPVLPVPTPHPTTRLQGSRGAEHWAPPLRARQPQLRPVPPPGRSFPPFTSQRPSGFGGKAGPPSSRASWGESRAPSAPVLSTSRLPAPFRSVFLRRVPSSPPPSLLHSCLLALGPSPPLPRCPG